MLFLAILATIASFVWSVFVVYANGMAPAPTAAGFQGGWSIIAAWIVTIVLWIAWAVG